MEITNAIELHMRQSRDALFEESDAVLGFHYFG